MEKDCNQNTPDILAQSMAVIYEEDISNEDPSLDFINVNILNPYLQNQPKNLIDDIVNVSTDDIVNVSTDDIVNVSTDDIDLDRQECNVSIDGNVQLPEVNLQPQFDIICSECDMPYVQVQVQVNENTLCQPKFVTNHRCNNCELSKSLDDCLNSNTLYLGFEKPPNNLIDDGVNASNENSLPQPDEVLNNDIDLQTQVFNVSNDNPVNDVQTQHLTFVTQPTLSSDSTFQFDSTLPLDPTVQFDPTLPFDPSLEFVSTLSCDSTSSFDSTTEPDIFSNDDESLSNDSVQTPPCFDHLYKNTPNEEDERCHELQNIFRFYPEDDSTPQEGFVNKATNTETQDQSSSGISQKDFDDRTSRFKLYFDDIIENILWKYVKFLSKTCTGDFNVIITHVERYVPAVLTKGLEGMTAIAHIILERDLNSSNITQGGTIYLASNTDRDKEYLSNISKEECDAVISNTGIYDQNFLSRAAEGKNEVAHISQESEINSCNTSQGGANFDIDNRNLASTSQEGRDVVTSNTELDKRNLASTSQEVCDVVTSNTELENQKFNPFSVEEVIEYIRSTYDTQEKGSVDEAPDTEIENQNLLSPSQEGFVYEAYNTEIEKQSLPSTSQEGLFYVTSYTGIENQNLPSTSQEGFVDVASYTEMENQNLPSTSQEGFVDVASYTKAEYQNLLSTSQQGVFDEAEKQSVPSTSQERLFYVTSYTGIENQNLPSTSQEGFVDVASYTEIENQNLPSTSQEGFVDVASYTEMENQNLPSTSQEGFVDVASYTKAEYQNLLSTSQEVVFDEAENQNLPSTSQEGFVDVASYTEMENQNLPSTSQEGFVDVASYTKAEYQNLLSTSQEVVFDEAENQNLPSTSQEGFVDVASYTKAEYQNLLSTSQEVVFDEAEYQNLLSTSQEVVFDEAENQNPPSPSQEEFVDEASNAEIVDQNFPTTAEEVMNAINNITMFIEEILPSPSQEVSVDETSVTEIENQNVPSTPQEKFVDVASYTEIEEKNLPSPSQEVSVDEASVTEIENQNLPSTPKENFVDVASYTEIEEKNLPSPSQEVSVDEASVTEIENQNLPSTSQEKFVDVASYTEIENRNLHSPSQEGFVDTQAEIEYYTSHIASDSSTYNSDIEEENLPSLSRKESVDEESDIEIDYDKSIRTNIRTITKEEELRLIKGKKARKEYIRPDVLSDSEDFTSFFKEALTCYFQNKKENLSSKSQEESVDITSNTEIGYHISESQIEEHFEECLNELLQQVSASEYDSKDKQEVEITDTLDYLIEEATRLSDGIFYCNVKVPVEEVVSATMQNVIDNVIMLKNRKRKVQSINFSQIVKKYQILRLKSKNKKAFRYGFSRKLFFNRTIQYRSSRKVKTKVPDRKFNVELPYTKKRKACHLNDDAPINLQPEIKKKKTGHLIVGFLGLGVMGELIVMNLLKYGHSVTVYNRTEKKCINSIKAGAHPANSPADVIIASDITFCCLSNSQASKSIFFAKESGVLEGFKRCRGSEKGYVEMTSIDEKTSKEFKKHLTDAGGRYLEAPMNGSIQHAKAGELAIVAAGSKLLYNSCKKTIFPAISKKFFFVGQKVGTAAVMHLGDSLLSGVATTAFLEAMSVARNTNINEKDVVNLLGLFGYNSSLLGHLGKSIKNVKYPPAFPLKNLQNQMSLALNLQGAAFLPMAVSSASNRVFQRVNNHLSHYDSYQALKVQSEKLQSDFIC